MWEHLEADIAWGCLATLFLLSAPKVVCNMAAGNRHEIDPLTEQDLDALARRIDVNSQVRV